MASNIDISVVIPTYNEEKNVAPLYKELKAVLDKLRKSYELIFVDDGSTDRTFENLLQLNKKDKNIKIIKFRKNFGQTSAIDAGFKLSEGKIVIGMDADLQDDPKEIPKLLGKLKEGYDAVGAWRFYRQDSFSKRIFSKLACLIRKIFTGEKVYDSGTTFKAYKKECLEDLDLFGEMHRYIPYLLIWKGFKFTEVKVQHHKRKFGKSKYNIQRLFKGFLDLLVVKFWMQYSARPIHLFGGLGLLSTLLGLIIGLYLSFMKIFFGEALSNRPLLLLSILLIIIGIQFIVFGLIADIMIKTYYVKSNKKPYAVERIIKWVS
jgi:glycosyltransferase involved in cell wall biosynthesis